MSSRRPLLRQTRGRIAGVAGVAASGVINLWTLTTSVTCLRAWQSDFGVVLGGTPLASGTGPPPALTLTDSVAGNAPALRVEIQTTGTDGVATYRYGAANDGTTSTWIESGKVVPAGGGTYAAIGALDGIVFNWPAGTYTNDNVYQGTCSAWVCQVSATTAIQATAGKQPLILLNTTVNRLFLRFDGTDDTLFEATLNLPAPGVTNAYFSGAITQRTWGANKSVFGSGSGGGTTQVVGNTATPTLKGFNSTAFTGASNGAALGSVVRLEALFGNTIGDYVKTAASVGTGVATGPGDPAAGLNIGSSGPAANFGAFDIYYLAVFAGNPTGGEKTATDAAMSSMYPGIGV